MPEKKSLKQQAYDEIKRKIVTCEYAPNTLLNEELLREELHVSRTPIRDALSRLEQKGLITILPKKGIMVSSLSINDINMVFEVRMMYAVSYTHLDVYKRQRPGCRRARPGAWSQSARTCHPAGSQDRAPAP